MLRIASVPVVAIGAVVLLGATGALAGVGPGADGVGDPIDPSDGNGGYRASHYDVKLDYDPAKSDFLIGGTTVSLVTSRELNEAKEGHNLDADYRQTVEANRADADFWKTPLADPGESFYGGSYTVGPLMLHALRRTVGDTAFFRMLRDWLRQHRYGNASWLDFETFASRQSGTNLDGFFQAWAHSSTIPSDRYLYSATLAAK